MEQVMMNFRCLFINIHISHFSKVITHICNHSFSQGLFPPDLAIAKVNCILKYGDKNDPTNYLSILVLPAFAKILEKKVEVRLSMRLTRNRLLKSVQFDITRRRQLTWLFIQWHCTRLLYLMGINRIGLFH